MSKITPFHGFSKLNFEERLHELNKHRYLDDPSLHYFLHPHLPPLSMAEKFIENVIGYFPIPIGVAVNFEIDGRKLIIPMAVEETSIIAAASKTARWIVSHGHITTGIKGHLSIGQIQIAQVKNFSLFENIILENKLNLMEEVNHDIAKGLVTRGGGVKDIEIRRLKRPDGQDMAVLHVLIDTCDAMGANIINQICEFLKPHIERLTDEHVNMCILSNLNDTRLAWAKITMENIDSELVNELKKRRFLLNVIRIAPPLIIKGS